MSDTIRTIGSVRPTSRCCGKRIVVGSTKNFKLTALRERSDGGARISARNAGGALDVGWRYEIDARCPECGELLAWNLEGLREYLKGGETQGEKPPLRKPQQVDHRSSVEEIGKELARWIGYRFPTNSEVRDEIDAATPENTDVEEWWLNPDGQPVQKPDVTDREFAEEVLERMQNAPNIASVSVYDRGDEWGASIEVEEDEPAPRKPRLETSSLRMMREGSTGDSFAEAVLLVALHAADAGVLLPAEDFEYSISRSGGQINT